MDRRWAWVGAWLAGGLLACPPQKAGPGDGGGDGAAASASAAVDAAAPLAVNEPEVSRYPDETPVNHAPLETVWSVSNVRTQASNSGELVAVLSRRTDVDKIAERPGWFLVLFDDPSDRSRKEMGWINSSVFSPEPPHKVITIKCTGAGQVPILLQGGEEACVLQCTSDSQCPKPQLCDGDGVLSSNGQPGAAVRFCRIASIITDAGGGGGPPPTVDAGGGPPATVDAGGGATTVDSGGPPPAADAGGGNVPCPKPLDVKQQGGKCTAPYKVCGAVCRLGCTSDGDCVCAPCAGGFCLGKGAAPCAH